MPSFRRATVTEILLERRGLQRVAVGADRAYVLTQLTGPVAVGDDVIVNTTAVELSLGTGGWHVVHWNLSRDEWSEPGPGHIMKLRYTSLQADVGAGEEQHPDLPERIDGTPVVVAGLHSQVPGIAVGVRAERPDARISYVMTDGAALPIAISDLVVDLRRVGLLDATVTAGHAFGGDLEAVTVASALTLARHVQGADVIVVAMGPGVVGTGTRLGTTAIEVAAIVVLVDALGGTAVLCPRWSDADHAGATSGAEPPHPDRLGLIHGPCDRRCPRARHLRRRSHPPPDRRGSIGLTIVAADAPDVGARLARLGLRVTTMGRGPDQEPTFFAICGVAGVLAAGLIIDPPPPS